LSIYNQRVLVSESIRCLDVNVTSSLSIGECEGLPSYQLELPVLSNNFNTINFDHPFACCCTMLKLNPVETTVEGDFPNSHNVRGRNPSGRKRTRYPGSRFTDHNG